MRIKDMLACSRRVFFENDDPNYAGYEYASIGSGFLCRYRDHDFAVTAEHVTRGFAADALRVAYYETARDFIPHKAKATIQADGDEDDPDWRDLAIYPLDRSFYTDAMLHGQLPYALPLRDSVWQPGMHGMFIMRGYLNQASVPDYDAKVLHQQAAILEADYAGPAQSMKHCHQIKFRDVSHCAGFGDPSLALDGLSGSAVFWLSDSKPPQPRFAGVLLRATYTSGIGYFVHGAVLLAALDKLLTPGATRAVT